MTPHPRSYADGFEVATHHHFCGDREGYTCVGQEGSVGLCKELVSITFDSLAERQLRILKWLSLESLCLT